MEDSGISSTSWTLARKLLAYESSPRSTPLSTKPPSVAVCEKISVALTPLMGGAAFQSLLGRALKLAKQDSADLEAVTITDKRTLEGITGSGTDAGAAVAASLLSLLVIFIGESLTLRLLHDVWPALNIADSNRTESDQ
jgi:hypothetical protein